MRGKIMLKVNTAGKARFSVKVKSLHDCRLRGLIKKYVKLETVTQLRKVTQALLRNWGKATRISYAPDPPYYIIIWGLRNCCCVTPPGLEPGRKIREKSGKKIRQGIGLKTPGSQEVYPAWNLEEKN